MQIVLIKQLGMNKERLVKIAEHLESGKLGADKFDYSSYGYKSDCGSAACAIGEFATIFPMDWYNEVSKNRNGFGVYQLYPTMYRSDLGIDSCIIKYLGISQSEVDFIFYDQPESSTASDIAKVIREFIKSKEDELQGKD